MWPFSKRNSILENPSVPLNQYFSTNQTSVITDNSSVMAHPIVRRGVSLISNLAGTLPLNVMKDGGVSGREVETDHPWQFRLNVRPTPFCNRSTWMQKLICDSIVNGNGYNLIQADNLLWLDPRSVNPDISNGQLIYRTIIDGQPRTLSQDQVIHVKNLTHDTIQGEALADALLDAMAAGLSMYKHVRHFFENGTFSNLVWSLPPSVRTEEKAKEFKDRIEAKHGGVWNSFKNIFLSEGAAVTPLTVNNQVSQTQELLEFDIVVVAAALGLPPSSLGANQNTSFKSLEVEDKKMLRDINPWLIQIEQELTSKLMTEEDLRSQNRWIEFNRKAAIEMDSQTELDLLTKGLQSAIYSKEFVRRKLNVPIEDIDGESYFYPANLQSYKGGDETEPVVDSEPPEDNAIEPEPVESETDQDSEATSDSEGRNQQLDLLIESTIDRLVTRIANSNKPAIEHRKVWNESLGMFANSEQVLLRLGDMIDGATESRKEIAANIDKVWMIKTLKSEPQA